MFQFLQKQALCKIYLFLLILSPLATQAQEISESGLRLPSGPIYTPQEPRLEFSYLETYDKPPDSKDEQVLAKDRMNQSTTTFVYVQIEMKNLLLGVRDQEYKLTFKYFIEGKELLGEYSTNFISQKRVGIRLDA